MFIREEKKEGTVYSDLHVLPMPKRVEPAAAWTEFGRRPMPAGVTCTERAWEGCADVFRGYLRRLYGAELAKGPGILLDRDASLGEEEYILDTMGEEIRISASSASGAHHAFATLLQMTDGREVVCARIRDWPELEYRGLMADLARQPHRFEEVLCYIDYCYLLKMNRLQLHFSDDQSYTLPSRRFPALPTPGFCFTEEEIRRINAYALERGVVIVPEVDMPGHCGALIQAYPDLFGNEHAEEGKDNVLCLGRPDAFAHIRELMEEVVGMFPDSPFIHIGGDEVAGELWENCPRCRAFCESRGLAGIKGLYTYAVAELARMVLDMGRTPIVWEGFPEESADIIPRETVVIGWESYYQTADRLIASGFKVINASWQPLYIAKGNGWDPEKILAWNVYEWQHWWEKSEAHLNPIHLQPTPQVCGSQLCLWEGNFEQEMPRLKENLPALSERIWTIRRYCEDAQFREKLADLMPLLERLDPRGAK